MRAPLCSVSLALVAVAPLAQKRVEQPRPADFPEVVAAAEEAWKAERYGACMGQLNKALALAMEKRARLIAAALPTAPEGWTLEVEDVSEQALNSPLAAGLLATMGSQVTARYRQRDGEGRLEVAVHADSPMIQMLGVLVSNPALLDPDSELIEYEQHKAVLTTLEGSPSQLQVLLHEKHLLDVQVYGLSEERLFALLDQAAIDRLAAALER
jgi:hypothetical protein